MQNLETDPVRFGALCGCLVDAFQEYPEADVVMLTKDLDGSATTEDRTAYGDYTALEAKALAALDACLAALEMATPAGTPVWLADDAQAGPRGVAIVERWLRNTRLRAEYTRRAHPIGESAHLQEMLRACGDADVVVLAADAQPLPGWLPQLAACLARDAAIATATPWCNAGETAGWPGLVTAQTGVFHSPRPPSMPLAARPLTKVRREVLHCMPFQSSQSKEAPRNRSLHGSSAKLPHR